MPEWLMTVVIVAGGMTGTGGLYGAGKLTAKWLDDREDKKHQRALSLEKSKHDYQADILRRLEAFQERELQARDRLLTALTEEREKRLADTTKFTTILVELTSDLKEALERKANSTRPSPR